MPSRFPGMDPFIESQMWEDFHTDFIAAIRQMLVPSVRPKYFVEVERRIYLEAHDPETPFRNFIADAVVSKSENALKPSESAGAGVAVLDEVAVEPKTCVIPYPDERRESFITIRGGSQRDIVTVIELLSPTNKRAGTDGRKKYVAKMEEILKTKVHYVEIDLLRDGQRTEVIERPPGDYFAIVSRSSQRPRVDVYGWPLFHTLPTIKIPLSGDDPDVDFNLQEVFNLVYDRAGYDYSIDYKQPLVPAMDEELSKRISKLLA
ncbi:hypothetical protein LF1_42740 [Rubripirellula obstinata]|uniref:DUF4058 domain-containing protein n=1 Tax=Rubripirellula obstinata TaxID=406547 RepID=A0A5B1CPD8_9BACT|nr:DUF4058 family protein [Rubripirellula obstinata]KAA1261719.1 hypothetical protein LF1_42740 [Rubripirellula obstinata]